MKRLLRNRCFFFLLLSVLLLVACKTRAYDGLQNGDLLFVTAKNTGLSGAINNVTQKTDVANFDHVGIVKKEGKNYFVLHAAPKGGSQKQDLESFIEDQASEGQGIVSYRLKPEFQSTISAALENAEKLLGKPYNFNYILNDNSLYCSDFIERIFRQNHIFKLEPMTFIDPKTGKTNEFWKEFYSKKGLKVPEGELGCNPNGLASSEKILLVKVLK